VTPFLHFQIMFWTLEEVDPVVEEIDWNVATEEGSQTLDPVGMDLSTLSEAKPSALPYTKILRVLLT
jgi:hypothetical protein